ncbi:MAG: hypothetical protein JWQ00_3241 [Noviherbaspirillum sp.]|nr:hypothetical protein [Noviherbaspirillum sp.]
MSPYDPNEINRLIGEFTDLQDAWQNDPAAFDWTPLVALARRGATAYNEGYGPSLHALAIDGALHTEFHERFLSESLRAGFDPFKLARVGSGTAEVPVIDHASLAEEADSNPSSERMRAALMEVARARFGPLVQEYGEDRRKLGETPLYRTVEACAESIPLDILDIIAPELARLHHTAPKPGQVNPAEGYLSGAEMAVDRFSKTLG